MDRSKKNLHRPEYIIFHFRKVVGQDTHRAWELRFAVALFRHRDTSETLTAEQYYSLIQAGALAFGAAYEELRDAFPYRDFQEGADAFAFLAGVWAGRIDSNECRGNIVSDAQDRLKILQNHLDTFDIHLRITERKQNRISSTVRMLAKGGKTG